MIIKNFQLENKNIIKYNFFLFYGDNEGFKNEKINDICKITKYTRFLYYEKEVLNDLEGFLNSLSTKSFFENEKIIILKDSTDKILNHIKEIINKKLEGIKIILNADVLDKRVWDSCVLKVPFCKHPYEPSCDCAVLKMKTPVDVYHYEQFAKTLNKWHDAGDISHWCGRRLP